MAQLIDDNYSPQQFDPKEIHSDHGGEFTSHDWRDMCRERHIKPSYAAPNTPQHNGLAERTHSVSINMARAMLASAPYLDPNKHWKDAHQLAILIRNLTPMPILGNKCPWELWHGTMPREFPVLLPFGTKVFYHTKDKAKFNQRTAEGLYMGPTGLRISEALDLTGAQIRQLTAGDELRIPIPKTLDSRVLFLPETYIDLFRNVLQGFALPEGDDKAIKNCYGMPLKYRVAENWLHPYFLRLHELSGVKGSRCVFTSHAFRRGYINRLFQEGMILPEVAQVVGHDLRAEVWQCG